MSLMMPEVCAHTPSMCVKLPTVSRTSGTEHVGCLPLRPWLRFTLSIIQASPELSFGGWDVLAASDQIMKLVGQNDDRRAR